MTATIVPKRGKVKEPSIDRIAKAKARGEKPPSSGQARPKPSAVGDSYVQVLKHGLAEMLDAPGDVLSGMTFDERRFAADFRANLGPTAEECSRAGEILASFRRWQREVQKREARSVPGNGQAKKTADDTEGTDQPQPKSVASVKSVVKNPELAAAAETAQEVEIDCDLVEPHPANRRSADGDEDVQQLAASIKEEDLLQAITVRPKPGDPERMQIIFGERRWRACRVAGRGSVRCKIRTDVDDATALRLTAIENGLRKDLNPIEKARLIQTLCEPSAGLQGMTREQAAGFVGLKDGASASNLVRLLKLPEPWLSRVASGELEQSCARLLLPVLELPPVIKSLEADWQQTHKPNRPAYNRTAFDARKDLEDSLRQMLRKECRRLDDSHYGGRVGYFGDIRLDLAKLTPEQRSNLQIVAVELPGKKKGQTEKVELATNAKYFDQLIDEEAKRRVKRKAEKSGRDSKSSGGEKRELSPAERRELEKELAEQLGKRIAAWRHKLLRRACCEALDAGLDTGLRLVLAAAADTGYGTLSLSDAFGALDRPNDRYCDATGKSDYWPCVGGLHDNGLLMCKNHVTNFVPELAKQFLAHETSDWRRPSLAHSLVESYAAAIGVNLAQAWSQVQHDGPELVEEFFLLHQTKQLRQLAGELGVHVAENATRAAMVKLLMSKLSSGSTFRYKLPKSICPLAVEKRKTKRTSRMKDEG